MSRPSFVGLASQASLALSGAPATPGPIAGVREQDLELLVACWAQTVPGTSLPIVPGFALLASAGSGLGPCVAVFARYRDFGAPGPEAQFPAPVAARWVFLSAWRGQGNRVPSVARTQLMARDDVVSGAAFPALATTPDRGAVGVAGFWAGGAITWNPAQALPNASTGAHFQAGYADLAAGEAASFAAGRTAPSALTYGSWLVTLVTPPDPPREAPDALLKPGRVYDPHGKRR